MVRIINVPTAFITILDRLTAGTDFIFAITKETTTVVDVEVDAQTLAIGSLSIAVANTEIDQPDVITPAIDFSVGTLSLAVAAEVVSVPTVETSCYYNIR